MVFQTILLFMVGQTVPCNIYFRLYYIVMSDYTTWQAYVMTTPHGTSDYTTQYVTLILLYMVCQTILHGTSDYTPTVWDVRLYQWYVRLHNVVRQTILCGTRTAVHQTTLCGLSDYFIIYRPTLHGRSKKRMKPQGGIQELEPRLATAHTKQLLRFQGACHNPGKALHITYLPVHCPDLLGYTPQQGCVRNQCHIITADSDRLSSSSFLLYGWNLLMIKKGKNFLKVVTILCGL